MMLKRSFFSSNLKSSERIGPHDFLIIELFFGSLLGDCYAEKRNNSTRFVFHQSSRNVEYISFIVNTLVEFGYCSKGLKKKKQIGKKNKVYFSIKKATFSFSSLNWVYDCFYSDKKKKIPDEISFYLTARALAFWLMDDGSRTKYGIVISTNSFTRDDINRLRKALLQNFDLETTTQVQNENQYRIYFPKSQIVKLRKIVQPFFVNSMLYKLDPYNLN